MQTSIPKEAKILITIAILVILGAVALAITKPKTDPAAKQVNEGTIIRDNSHSLIAGAATNGAAAAKAKVRIVEFGDYQCPACGYAEPIVQKILLDYKDNANVSFTFRNFPLSSVHANAIPAAIAAETAAQHGKFWEMHDMLYAKQTEWSDLGDATTSFVNYAEAIGIETVPFKSDLSTKKYLSVVTDDRQDGTDIDITGTPTFFINGEQLGNGVPTYEAFKAKIDSLLAQ